MVDARSAWSADASPRLNRDHTEVPPRPAPSRNRWTPAAKPGADSTPSPCRNSLAIASPAGSDIPSSVAARSLRRQACGSAATSRARSSAAARAWPGGTTRSTRPIASASAAGTARPVRIRSRARPRPISRGSRTVPPSISGTPNRRQKTPSTASCSATRRSHQAASSSPPATAYPLIAAITGLPSRSRVGPIGPSPSGLARLPSGPPTALRSAPAQNVPPAPQSTATCADSSASKSRNASARAAAVGPSTAFRASGRSRMTVVTGPDRSARTLMARSVHRCPSRSAFYATERLVVVPGGQRGSADFPGVGAGQERAQVAVTLLGAGVDELGGHEFVVGIPWHLPEHPDRGVREVRPVQAGQRERVRRVSGVRVVRQQRVRVGALGDDRLQRAVPGEPEPLGAVRAEPDRLTVLQPDQPGIARVRLLQRRERVVVEDRAVLVDLDERSALVVRGGPEHAREVLAVGVDRPGHEAGLRAERQRDRVERGVQRAERGRLGDLALLGGGRVLALGKDR